MPPRVVHQHGRSRLRVARCRPHQLLVALHLHLAAPERPLPVPHQGRLPLLLLLALAQLDLARADCPLPLAQRPFLLRERLGSLVGRRGRDGGCPLRRLHPLLLVVELRGLEAMRLHEALHLPELCADTGVPGGRLSGRRRRLLLDAAQLGRHSAERGAEQALDHALHGRRVRGRRTTGQRGKGPRGQPIRRQGGRRGRARRPRRRPAEAAWGGAQTRRSLEPVGCPRGGESGRRRARSRRAGQGRRSAQGRQAGGEGKRRRSPAGLRHRINAHRHGGSQRGRRLLRALNGARLW
mmetsp:Transcript_5242/g.17398  ORF Transcript_5242/g.17398 Transcript_5242/m.17398 type:complete len:295 (+) Transcript_5242:488-1372(+)